MIRRSRISVRPNVGRPGKAGGTATPQDEPTPSQMPAEPPANEEDNTNTTALQAGGDSNNDSTPAGLTTAGHGEAPGNSGDATTPTPASAPTPTPTSSSSASVQRRKRFSVKPKVSAAPARASARGQNPDPDTHVQASKPTPREGPAGPPGSDLDEPSPPPGAAAAAAAAEAQHVDPVAQAHQEGDGSGDKHGKPSAHTPDPAQEARVERDENPKGRPASRAKGDVPPKPPDKISAPVPPSLPEREAMEISERAKSLVSKSGREARGGLVSSSKKLQLEQLLHDQTDLQRLAKARRLRELLRQEMLKERAKHRDRKSRCRAKEYTLDPSKMTMRDLVHYLPESNPMTSSLEASTPENETVVPRSPAREEPPQDPEAASQGGGDTGGEEDEDEEEGGGGGGDDGVMVPRVKVAEDGSLIIDEESLMVEVKRAKGPNPANARDAIFERGSTTTYTSFRKRSISKTWSSEETDMFFLAVSMVGTDFSMICQLFPHRARSEIKNKFKREERDNSWRIDKAFKERRKLDLKFFSKLLEKIMEFQKNKKKTRTRKAPGEKRKPKTKKTNEP